MPQDRDPHLVRLAHVRVSRPIFFVTTCTEHRRPLLATPGAARILNDEWLAGESRHRWRVGRFVIMPDHVHFFVSPLEGAQSLEQFVGQWKQWTSKAITRATGALPPLWQHRFFDHLLRSKESYAEKWEYVRLNPVRAGLATEPDDWPYAGYVHFDSPLGG
jgi:putative transposase